MGLGGPPILFLAQNFTIAVVVSAKFCKSFFAPEAVADTRTKSAKLLRECIPQFSEPIKKGTTRYKEHTNHLKQVTKIW